MQMRNFRNSCSVPLSAIFVRFFVRFWKIGSAFIAVPSFNWFDWSHFVMTRSLSNILTLFLAFVGCGVALMLTIEHFTKAEVGCFKSGEGCASAISSAYGNFHGIPTAVFGLAMYVTLVGLCFARGKQLRSERSREAARAAAYAVSGADDDGEADSERVNAGETAVRAASSFSSREPRGVATATIAASGDSVRRLDLMIWGIALLGFGISIWLQYISLYQMGNFCKYCFTSATIVTLIFALASRDYLLDGRTLNGEQKMLVGVIGFILVMCSFIIGPQIWDIASKKQIKETPVLSDNKAEVTNQLLHVKGDPKAKYMLVEFADYMCGHCAHAAPEVETALQQHPHDMRFVFRNFPLPSTTHRWARQAAQAAEAAGEQGKFWEMHDLLFKRQEQLEDPTFKDDDFEQIASTLKLDIKKFNKDRNSDTIHARVQKDLDAGNSAEVHLTPTFFFVTPTQVTKFAGIPEFRKFMANPKGSGWK
jgi:protein-disulfide isomerase/uncharacterized membrane protein